MGGILNLGVAIVLFLQSLGLWLKGPMSFFTFMGTEPFFLLIGPAVLWCIDAGLGLRASIGLTVSNILNLAIKVMFLGPRPYWFDARVQPLSTESSLGAPSGHAQNSVVVWGILAAGIKRRWAWAGAILLMFLIGLSRIYLGVHFPHDVIIGWLIGAAVLWIMLRVEKAILPWLKTAKAETLVAAAFGLALGLTLVSAGIVAINKNWTLPEAWSLLAARVPGAAPDPFTLHGVIATAAALFGMASGAVMLRDSGWFDAGGVLWKRMLRYVIGLAGMLALYIGLDQVFPDGSTALPTLLLFIRYTLVGMWITYLAPELFIKLKLADRPVRILEAVPAV